jgi:phosphoglucosamine mutase
MKRRFFGTDGIRGPYGGPVVNEGFFEGLGAAVARWLGTRGAAAGTVLVGRDTRASGEPLVRAFAAGAARAGCRPVSVGVVPTPAVSRATLGKRAALGCAVTASHNPSADNGIKFFGPDGAKLSDADEAGIEALLGQAGVGPPGPAGAGPVPAENIEAAYMESAARLLPAGSLRGWKLALDTANGATWHTSPGVFRSLGADVAQIGDRPDGANINAGVGSEHPEALSGLVRSSGARFGVAHDGDGDRLVLCDEAGQVVDGDEILTALAVHALGRGTLRNKTLVVTVQSNLGVDRAVEAAGGRVLRSAVGDRYVAELMRASGAALGGESSGHIVNFDHSPTGDGLVAALMVAGLLRESGRPLSELRRSLRKFPQATRALGVRERVPLERLSALPEAIRALESELGSSGRVLVRYSGTEAKLRLLVEAPSEAIVSAAMERLVAAARSELGPA